MNRFETFFNIFGACTLGLAIAACGGGDDDDGNNATPDAGVNTNADAAVTPVPDAAIDFDATPVADCADCVEEATCDDSGEQAVCECPQFFEGDGTVAGTGCVATVADECADGTDTCGESFCIDADIGFTCNQLITTSPYSAEYLVINPEAFLAGRFDNAETEVECDGPAVAAQRTLTDSVDPALEITGTTGLARHPDTGVLYIVYKVAGVDGRPLGTLDAATGVITSIGNTGDNVSALAFDGDGNLFASSGDGATTSESLFLVDQATAALTLITDLPDGSDGTIIGFNEADGFLYHLGGRDTNPGADLIDVTVDSTDPLNIIITSSKATVARGGYNFDEPFGLISGWPSSGGMGLVNLDNELVDITFDPTDPALPTLDATLVEGVSTTAPCTPGPSAEAPSSYMRGIALAARIVTPLADGEACTANFECEGVCDIVASNQCEPVNTCGNGIIEGVETCDDGNTDDADGCEGDCGVILLADGETCGTDYECINVCDSLGSDTCEPADTCGNGNLEGAEECDDGNTDDGDGCSLACVIELI
tara:strand:+ start:31709 stop:33328 length:1620 start_codon:yes stop_codon:yes gene_type:complete